MSLSATLTKSIKLSTAYAPVSGVEVITEGLALELNDTVASNSTSVFSFSFDKDKLKALFVVTSLDSTTIFKKSGPATELSLSLLAGVPYDWTNSYTAVPFANDIVSISVNNASLTAALTIQVMAIVDPT